MIVILCPGYADAEEAYFTFISILECFEYMGDIINRYDDGLCVVTDDDLTYIFIDEHWQKVVEKDLPDTVDWDYMETFFEDIYNDDPPWYY